MRKTALWALLLAALLALSGCAGLSASEATPDLRLLEPLPAPSAPPAQAPDGEEADSLRLDLWLDASQVMGGINPSEESMYPHASRKYREGGFHYRYESQVGMYETVLRCMLSSAEGSRVRLLRCGSERLPDSFLISQGAAQEGMSRDQLRSIRRDMLTYAIDPMPDVFTGFSGESMANSFYSPGSPLLNQMPNLDAGLLENPSLKAAMSAALDAQIEAIAQNTGTDLLVGDGSALFYALENMDLSRLSVIICDPAGIRRLTEVDAAGDAHALAAERLSERGVFDAGLSVGLYAFTLDYMGQLASFGAADFSEPLLWGRLDYDNKTGRSGGALVMPRTLLALVVGKPAEVEAWTASFQTELAASDTLKVPRGPQDGQLVYTRNGQTVVQQPFGFAYEYTCITRAQLEPITQHTPGTALTADGAQLRTDGGLTTVALTPENGVQPDRTLVLQLPLPDAAAQGATLDAAQLTNIRLTVQDSLLLTQTLPNTPDAPVPDGAQCIALRDRIYLFTHEACQSPVSCTGIQAGDQCLQVRLRVDGGALQPGYYRILLSADLPAGSMTWRTPEWVSALNTTITNAQISEWEAFSAVLTQYERKRDFISRPFQHAWGDAENTSYRGHAVPDFPPVMLSPGLSELFSQLQSAAQPGDMPFIRYTFDLFVDLEP